MLIIGDRKFVLETFDSEDELERVVIANAEYFFGPLSIFFPKSLIKTSDGAGTIPDGYVIDLEGRQWYIVEAELSQHNVWTHIAPQVAKQIIAAKNPDTKQRLIEVFITHIKDDENLQEKFLEQNIEPIDFRSALAEILDTEPIIGMPIDNVKNDLREWAKTLSVDVRLWVVQKYVDFDNPQAVMYEIPEDFRPVLDTSPDLSISTAPNSRSRIDHKVSVSDLLDEDLLSIGQRLLMPYKPRNGNQNTYEAFVMDDGSLKVLGRSFSSVSDAAIFCIQDAGSPRKTENGWTHWKLENGSTLADLRDRLLLNSKTQPPDSVE